MNYSGQRGTKRIRVDEISFRDIVADSIEAKTIGITDEFTFPEVDGTVDQVMKTNGNGGVTWEDEAGGGTTPTMQEVYDASGPTPTITTSVYLRIEPNPGDLPANRILLLMKPDGFAGWSCDRAGVTRQVGVAYFEDGLQLSAALDPADPFVTASIKFGAGLGNAPFFQVKSTQEGLVQDLDFVDSVEDRVLLSLNKNAVRFGDSDSLGYTFPSNRVGQLRDTVDHSLVWDGSVGSSTGTWVPLPMKFSQTVTTLLANSTTPTLMTGTGGGTLALDYVRTGTSFIIDYNGDIETEQKAETMTIDVLASNGVDPPVVLANMVWTIDEIKAFEPYSGRVKCTFTNVDQFTGQVLAGTVQGSLEHHTEDGARGGLLNSTGPPVALDTLNKSITLSLAFTWTSAFPNNAISIRQLTAYQVF